MKILLERPGRRASRLPGGRDALLPWFLARQRSATAAKTPWLIAAGVLCAALFCGLTALPAAMADDDAAPAGETAMAAAPDPRLVARGKRLYIFCRSCHATEEVEGSKIGPNLAGIFERRAALLEDTLYSDALKQQDFVWDEEKLDIWLLRPADLVPGTSMGFVGLPQKQNREAIIAYLKTL